MDTLLKIVQTVNLYLSDYILIIMLLGCGVYFTDRKSTRLNSSHTS